jgi:hypothetical protein
MAHIALRLSTRSLRPAESVNNFHKGAYSEQYLSFATNAGRLHGSSDITRDRTSLSARPSRTLGKWYG